MSGVWTEVCKKSGIRVVVSEGCGTEWVCGRVVGGGGRGGGGLSSAAGWRGGPGAIFQTQAPPDTLHGVAPETRVHGHVPELEHSPPHHPVGHVERRAAGHPYRQAQMVRPIGY